MITKLINGIESQQIRAYFGHQIVYNSMQYKPVSEILKDKITSQTDFLWKQGKDLYLPESCPESKLYYPNSFSNSNNQSYLFNRKMTILNENLKKETWSYNSGYGQNPIKYKTESGEQREALP